MPRSARVVAVLAALTLLPGCSPPAPAPGSGEFTGQTVEVAATWSGTEGENFTAVLNAFARKTRATVKYTSGGNDLPILINSRLAGGAPPDIAMIPQPGVVAQLQKRGVLTPLSGTAAAAVRTNYSQPWQGLGTIDGTLYGFYFKVANKSVIWYRTAAFDYAGVEPPKTWTDLAAASRTLSDSGVTPMVAAGGDGWVLTDWFENAYLRIGGPDRYDRLSRHDLPWTDESVVRTLRLLADYWRTPSFIQGGPSGALQVTFTQSIADVFGAQPKSAMLYEGDFVASEITKLGKFAVGDTAKFFDWPSIEGSRPAVVTAGDQAVAFTDTPVTMGLMAFLASPEAAAIMAARGGFLSANQNLEPSSYPDSTMRALARSVVSAELLRFDLSDLTPQSFGGGTSADMWVLLQDFLSQPIEPATMAQRLEDAANKDFGST